MQDRSELLQKIEDEITRSVADTTHEMRRIAESLTGAGGKRLRPRLAAELGAAAGIGEEVLVPLATAVELAHNATLLHDDVIDESPTRRGKPTAWALQGAGAGILSGNFLFMQTFRTLIDAGLAPQASSMANCIRRLVEGELIQAGLRWNASPEVADVRLVAERKTGEFFAWICRSLAETGGGDCAAAERWGTLLGFGFQLADDLLDFHQLLPAEKVGKPVRKDLREGYVTWPIAEEIQKNQELAQLLKVVFVSRDESQFEKAYDILAQGSVIQGLQKVLQETEDQLARSIDWLPNIAEPAKMLVRACFYREF